MYEDTLYERPALTEVICRIDFPSPLPGISNTLPAKLSRMALEYFPIREPKAAQHRELRIDGPNIKDKVTESTQWDFHGREREKTLTIVPQAIFKKASVYKHYDFFITEFVEILDVLFSEFPDAFASRIGLRYVNIVNAPGDDPFEWQEYINQKLLGLIEFPEDKKRITRAFNILELNFDGQAVKFQHGIANPDHPAVVKRKQFVLDLDSVFHGTFDCKEISENLTLAHEKIQSLFEESITDATRELMKPVPHEQ